jgi:hypothetical protein
VPFSLVLLQFSPEPRFEPELLQMEPLFSQGFDIQYRTEPYIGSSFRWSQMDVRPVWMSLNQSKPIIRVSGLLPLLLLFCNSSGSKDTYCQHISKFAGEIITGAIITDIEMNIHISFWPCTEHQPGVKGWGICKVSLFIKTCPTLQLMLMAF